jgi:AAA ATPase domain
MKLKTIRIENFRGIKQALEFPFKKGSNNTSLAIYGKNGTGKSSIVDAWEWFYNSKINHLAREGAGEKDYAHKGSDGTNTFIELEIEGVPDKVKFQFNNRRVTQPIIIGDYNSIIEKIPHPCHLRYQDLQRFVYLSKTEKYEYLAKYLGFEEALQLQNNFRTFSNTLQTQIEQFISAIEENNTRIIQVIGESTIISEENILTFINAKLHKHRVAEIDTFKKIKQATDALKLIVEQNPKAKELAEWKELKRKLERFYPITHIKENLVTIELLFNELKDDEVTLKNISRIDLYESGREVLESEDDKSICPLCDTQFAGDLIGHITHKHKALEDLKIKLEKFNNLKVLLQRNLTELISKIESINEFEAEIKESQFREFFGKINQLKIDVQIPLKVFQKGIFEIEKLDYSASPWLENLESIINSNEDVLRTVDENIHRLNEDRARKELTDDYSNIIELFTSFYRYELNEKKKEYTIGIKSYFDEVIDNYKDWVNSQIQGKFDEISAVIIDYFNLLENNHAYIRRPKIKLLTDRDKAIELEIEFAGEELSPAFKVLSESQINSFGLSVFLAAIKHFNTDFKLIILDDVINSFDSFKRPRVIELLRQHFSDHQFLVLTHDAVWYERLIRSFPNWNRLRFFGWDYSTGPKVEIGKDTFEQIQDDLDRDLGVDAGQKLGRYLEWSLQVLNQNFQSQVAFKILNEYTMNELFVPFKKRIKEKLRETHRLYILLYEFEEQTGFRNFCMHWKDGQYTSDEVQQIFDSWKTIEATLTCPSCNRYATYDSSTRYVKCRCSELDLKLPEYY